MKLLLLKILLQRRSKDNGYVLPMVIALGLVMVLLGAVNLTSAQEENFNAITQNSRTDALGIAEIGVAQYREFLDNNRILTVYNHDQWTSVPTPANPAAPNVGGQTCNVVTNTAGGWAYTEAANATFNPANWQPISLDETVLNRDIDRDEAVNNSNAIIGGYQLVSYEYDNDGVLGDNDDNGVFSLASDANPDDDPSTLAAGVVVNSIVDENDTDDDGVSDARGILTVKGRTLDGSETQIQVEIPIRINQQDVNNLAPALWIGNANTASLGGLIVGDSDGDNVTDDVVNNLTGVAGADGIPDANIVVSNPNDGTNDGCNNIAAVNGNTIITDARTIPPINTIAQTVTDAQSVPGGIGINNFSTLALALPGATTNLNYLGALNHNNYNPDFDPDTNPSTFDPDVDCARSSDCRYYYTNIPNIIGGRDYVTDGVAKSTWYHNGNLLINANNANPGSIFQMGSSISSQFMEIYATGNITITLTGQDATINALIHTPGTLTINSGGGNLTINGSVWAGNFVNNVATLGGVRINPDTTDTSSTTSDRSYEFYTTTSNMTPRPLTGSPTNWNTEETN